MSVLPVIVRELRAQARQPLTYWLRVIGGISLAGALALALLALSRIDHSVGRGPWFGRTGAGASPFQTFGVALFGDLNGFIFGAIWLFVPLAVADAVSRERREGTLVLLYLTELRAWGIVVGKAFVHLLRSLSLLLTMAPWLLLPVLFGGVELRDIRMALLLDLTSVLLAMSAGLLASTIPRDWLKSAIVAELFSVVLLLGMLHVHGLVLDHTVAAGMPAAIKPGTRAFWTSGLGYFSDFLPGSSHRGIIDRTSRLLALTTNAAFGSEQWFNPYSRTWTTRSDWGQIWTCLTPVGHAAWLHGTLGMVLTAGLILLAATWFGAIRVDRSWQDAPQQGPMSEWRQKFLTPRFAVPLLSRKLSRALSSNPVGWLQVYSPSARMVKWAWCLFIIVIEIVFSANPEDLYGAQGGLGLLLLLGLTFSAIGSFRQELETGAFELLLVTPLRERQIIMGRVRGLWRQFLPAMVVYGAGSIYLASGWSDHEYARQAWLGLARTMTGFCALPLIGLYFSVQRWNFFAAWLAACVIGLLPAAVGRALGAGQLSISIMQIALGLAAVVLLQEHLRNRTFLRRPG